MNKIVSFLKALFSLAAEAAIDVEGTPITRSPQVKEWLAMSVAWHAGISAMEAAWLLATGRKAAADAVLARAGTAVREKVTLLLEAGVPMQVIDESLKLVDPLQATVRRHDAAETEVAAAVKYAKATLEELGEDADHQANARVWLGQDPARRSAEVAELAKALLNGQYEGQLSPEREQLAELSAQRWALEKTLAHAGRIRTIFLKQIARGGKLISLARVFPGVDALVKGKDALITSEARKLALDAAAELAVIEGAMERLRGDFCPDDPDSIR